MPASLSRGRPSKQEAEALAVSLLGFLAQDPQRLGPFLAATGLGPGTLRAAATEPDFLVSLLDYALADERLLVAFSEAQDLDPSLIGQARLTLGGPPE